MPRYHKRIKKVNFPAMHKPDVSIIQSLLCLESQETCGECTQLNSSDGSRHSSNVLLNPHLNDFVKDLCKKGDLLCIFTRGTAWEGTANVNGSWNDVKNCVLLKI